MLQKARHAELHLLLIFSKNEIISQIFQLIALSVSISMHKLYLEKNP